MSLVACMSRSIFEANFHPDAVCERCVPFWLSTMRLGCAAIWLVASLSHRIASADLSGGAMFLDILNIFQLCCQSAVCLDFASANAKHRKPWTSCSPANSPSWAKLEPKVAPIGHVGLKTSGSQMFNLCDCLLLRVATRFSVVY